MTAPTHAASLLTALDQYATTWQRLWPVEGKDEFVQSKFRDLLGSPRCFFRENLPGHLTGSALVTTTALDQVLLTLHGKLGRWLQLGGHADGETRLDAVALREAEEESGLRNLHFLQYAHLFGQAGTLSPLILDLDIHAIPPRAKEPAHEHFDVRYVLVAESPEKIRISSESSDLRWFPLGEAERIAPEQSMRRQFSKLGFLRSRL